MVSELEKIKETEEKLLKVRLEITEKEQEKEKVQKMANVASYTVGFFLFLTLGAFAYATLAGIALLAITIFLFVFWALPKANKISKLLQEIDQIKKKKKKK